MRQDSTLMGMSMLLFPSFRSISAAFGILRVFAQDKIESGTYGYFGKLGAFY